jgi:hypothetical protein
MQQLHNTKVHLALNLAVQLALDQSAREDLLWKLECCFRFSDLQLCTDFEE